MNYNRILLIIKTRWLAFCITFSILGHIFFVYLLCMFGIYEFSAPVKQFQELVVNMVKPGDQATPKMNSVQQGRSDTNGINGGEIDEKHQLASIEMSRDEPKPDTLQRQSELTDSFGVPAERIDSNAENSEVTSPVVSPHPVKVNLIVPPSGTVREFQVKNEKLTYLVSMFGLPVGNAELESKNNPGDIWITLRVKSNAVISSIFPVYNVVETRHIDGKFIMTKIKQQEGSFKSDEEFTINSQKKRVLWSDHIRNRILNTTIPDHEVLDTLSGIYDLRNRDLQIGKTEILHIYDSETYADVPVEILRRETLRMLNLKEVNTLVVRPLQKTAGIFRRNGDILIWMTDDANKVPVKIVTSIALGKVTAELVSAESRTSEEK